jgi:hypothetical protein
MEKPTVHLQYCGRHTAKPAGDLVVGDVMVWNYGMTSVVVSITPKGAQSLTVVESVDGKEYSRVMRKTRLVACR